MLSTEDKDRIGFEVGLRMRLAFLEGSLHARGGDPATWMVELEDLVGRYPEHLQYNAAKLIYEEVNSGSRLVPIAPTVLYGWVVKWATLPDARGRRMTAA